MASQSQKQHIIDRIKEVTNILVTVSTNPSVDELSAALGVTIFLNELGKHATAVFSGEVPPAIAFLEPDKTFEDTADSLRDFIIALDKEKADHLRCKAVDDAVKIFITPYKTTISEADLEFSQGDYNVELVLALNVSNKDHLDKALTAHGKILHDATVVTVTSGNTVSDLGATDWHDDAASGVSEMLVELIGGLKTPKVTMSEQMATALLTGIVAATDRFSNTLTSSRVMTVAAELMAAGANQQLISAKLTESQQAPAPAPADEKPAPETVTETLAKGDDELFVVKKDAKAADEAAKQAKQADEADGDALTINHTKFSSLDEVAAREREEAQSQAARIAEAKLDKLTQRAEPVSEQKLPEVVVPDQVEVATPTLSTVSAPEITAEAIAPVESSTPLMGGTLNATTEQAAADKARELAGMQNKTILKHGEYIGATPPSFGDTPLNAAMGASGEPTKVDPFASINQLTSENNVSNKGLTLQPTGSDLVEATSTPETQVASVASNNATIAALNEDTSRLLGQTPDTRADNTKAQDALADVLAAAPSATGSMTQGVNPEGLPPLPDFSTLPPLPPLPTDMTAAAPTIAADTPVASDAALLAKPIGGLPTHQPDFDPNKFQIPGQS